MITMRCAKLVGLAQFTCLASYLLPQGGHTHAHTFTHTCTHTHTNTHTHIIIMVLHSPFKISNNT